MGYTLEQYETLKAAIASGANTVRYGDKSVTYNSPDQMFKVLSLMEAELFPDKKQIRRKLAIFDKGV